MRTGLNSGPRVHGVYNDILTKCFIILSITRTDREPNSHYTNSFYVSFRRRLKCRKHGNDTSGDTHQEDIVEMNRYVSLHFGYLSKPRKV